MTSVKCQRSAARGELVSRSEELGRLRTLIAAAKSGQGVSVLIEGEAGIGKTTLMNALAAECRSEGFRILQGRGEELEQRIPFQALHSCFCSVDHMQIAELATLTAVLRGQGGATRADWESSVTEAILTVLDIWCASGPVALLLDDMHWADHSSLVVLNRLQRILHQVPLLVCVAAQPTVRRTGLTSALRVLKDRGALSLRLKPLSDDDVAELVARLVGARPAPALLERMSAAAGNPLFVTEMATALTEDYDLAATDDVADFPGQTIPLPGSLMETALRRLDHLSHHARDMLEVVAVLGPRVCLSDLSTVLDMPVMNLWEMLGEAVETGLLTEVGDRLAFRHDLVRHALIESMPYAVRTALQQQAGERLAQAGAPVEQVAQYLRLAGTCLTTRTVNWLVQSAPALVLRAPDAAVELLDQALDMLRADDPRCEALGLQLTRALFRIKAPARAEAAAREALSRGCDPDGTQELRWLLAQSAYHQGDLERAVRTAELALAELADDASDAARFYAFIAQCQYLRGRLDLAEESANQAVAAGKAGQEAYCVAHGLTLLAAVRLPSLQTEEALELTERALVALGNQEARPDLPMAPHFIRGSALVDLDRLADAHRAFDHGLHACDSGVHTFLPWYHLGKARLHFSEGMWDDALAEIGAGLEASDHIEIRQALQSQAALIAVHRGGSGDCLELGRRSGDAVGTRYYGFLHSWARALTRESQGDPEGAFEELLAAWQRGLTSRDRRVHQLWPDIGRLAASLGDISRLRQLAATLTDVTTENLQSRAAALLCRGLAESDPNALVQSAELYRNAGRVLHEAYAQEVAASLFAASDRVDAARTALQTALSRYERLEAIWDARRAEEQLAAVGIRDRRRARRSPKSGWAALTTTERSIVGYVTEGHSNRDIGAIMFISPRTVQFHLSMIFTKLGIASRVELAVSACQQAVRPTGQQAAGGFPSDMAIAQL